MTAREANEFSDAIRAQMQRSVAQRAGGEKVMSYLDTDLFADLLHARTLSSPAGGTRLGMRAADFLPESVLGKLKESLGRESEVLTLSDLTAYDAQSLAVITGLERDVAQLLRLELLGLPLVERKDIEALQGLTQIPKRRKVEIPLLIGLQPREATRALSVVRLLLGSSTEVDSPLPSGSIVTQIPPAGVTVESNTEVSVTLASGLCVRLPEIVGLGLIEAGCRLRDAGLRSEPTVAGKPVPDAHVVALEPPAGTLVTPNTPVTISLRLRPDARYSDHS